MPQGVVSVLLQGYIQYNGAAFILHLKKFGIEIQATALPLSWLLESGVMLENISSSFVQGSCELVQLGSFPLIS